MKSAVFPEGKLFLELAAGVEEACASLTLERAEQLGKKVPLCLQRLGTILSLLYRETCCFYGCPGGDHFGQRIAGRVVNHALASFRMLCSGYYDESFALTRNIGEIANLLFLFGVKPELLEQWKEADEKTRWEEFRPAKVRSKLEKEGVPVPIDQTRYAQLCEAGVHLMPASTPQSHNPLGIPTLGSIFQEGGFIAALNELSGATGVCAAGLLRLLDLGDRKDSLKQASVELLRAVGGVDLSTLQNNRNGSEK